MKRGSIWANEKVKKLKTWRAKGSYNVKRGNRHFILTNLKTGTTRAFESPEHAKAEGWVIVEKGRK